jgi:hypothetical protein
MIRPTNGRFWCPLIFTVAGIVAIFALGLDGQAMALDIVLAILFVLPYCVSLRIPNSALLTWVVRIIVYVIVGIVADRGDNSAGDPLDPQFVLVFGELAAAEMVMQCWRLKPSGKPAGMGLIFFAGTAYMGATFTTTPGPIPWLTPVFFLLLILSWRRIEAQTLRDPMSLWAGIIYFAGLFLAVGAGGLCYVGLHENHDLVNSIAQRLLDVGSANEEAGMSSQPQLGSTFGLQGSSQRVLVLSGDPGDPHLRALAFHTYLSGSWGPATSHRQFTSAPETLGAEPVSQPIVHVRKEAYVDGLIFAPLNAGYFDLGTEGSSSWSPEEGGPIRVLSQPPSEYSFAASGDFSDILDLPIQLRELNADMVVPPSISSAVVTLTKSIIAGKKTDEDKVAAICERLDEDHKYSLKYTAGIGDPVSGFILSNKPAHCEYFASAAVIMLRIAGIPARYVIGYYAHERDQDGEVVVRQRDAHAWAEAYFDGIWHTVDATPSDGRPDEIFNAVSIWQKWYESLQDKLQFIQSLAQQVGPGKIAVITGILVGVYFLFRMAFDEFRKRFKRKNARSRPTDQLSAEAQRFEHLLRDRAIIVPSHQTWSEFFDVQQQVPLDRNKLKKFVDDYNAVRFGGEREDDLLSILVELEQSPKVESKK